MISPWPAIRTGVLDITRYGAIGDGAPHPLSDVFSSMAEAQKIYPQATALTEEIDFNAVRRAMADAKQYGGGGVYGPRGRYIMNNAAHPESFLRIPECRPSGTAGEQVNLIGDGWRNTVFKWPVDVGLNGSKYAVSCGDPAASVDNDLGRYGTGGCYEGYCMDLQLEGPVTSMAKGTKGCNLTGLAWGARRRLIRVQLRGFYAGLDVVGDWSKWEDVYTPDCYYGAYFAQRSNYLYGNIEAIKCLFTGCAMAGIALHPNGYIRGVFRGCFIGGSPYAIMMEAGAGDTMTHIISRFQDTQFEHVGNAMIGDENALNGGAKRLQIERTDFEGCASFFQDSNRILTGGRGRTALVQARSMKTVTFDQTSDMPEGSECVFDVDLLTGVDVKGNLFFLRALPVPFLKTTSGAHTMKLEDRVGGWRGRMVQMENATGCQLYDVLEVNAGRVRTGTEGTNPIAGIAQSNALAGQFVPVATRGNRLPIRATGSLTTNAWIKKAEGGAAQLANGPTDDNLIGFSELVDSGNNRFQASLSSQRIVGDLG